MMDALKAFWICVVFFLIFFGLPSRLFPRRPNTAIVVRIAGNFTRMVLLVTATVFLLASIKALTTITMIMFVVGALTAAWLRKHEWRMGNATQAVQAGALRFMRKAEGWSFGMYLMPRLRKRGITITIPRMFQIHNWFDLFESQGVLAAVFLAVVLMSTLLLWQNAWYELRFDQADQYAALLRGRELVLNLRAIGLPFIFPAMASTTSLIGATDLMQVTRYIFPLIEIFLVLTAGLAIRASTRSGVAAIATMYCLGAAAFPPIRKVIPVADTVFQKLVALFDYSPATTRPGAEFQLGLIFMLLAIVFLVDWQRNPQWDSLVNVGCCLALVAIASQFLAVVLIVALAAVLMTRPLAALMVFSLVCYGLAAYAALSGTLLLPNEVFKLLPLAGAIGVGCVIGWVREALSVVAGKHAEGVVFLGFLFLAVVWLRPHAFEPQFLEYEITARETQAIVNNFPRQKWAVVAPVEQLPETFGYGGYEDLATFIAEYQDRISNPDFKFPDAPDYLLVYVEKRPFQMFAKEPSSVSFLTLTDETFRNYRSPAGRASLETAALQFCETYKRSHSGATILFENDDLRIYEFQPPPKPAGKA